MSDDIPNLDLDTIEQMRAHGADITTPTDIDFCITGLQSKADVNRVKALLKKVGYRVDSHVPDDEPTHTIVATIAAVPTIEHIHAARILFEQIAKDHGGVYDGWGMMFTSAAADRAGSE